MFIALFIALYCGVVLSRGVSVTPLPGEGTTISQPRGGGGGGWRGERGVEHSKCQRSLTYDR